MKIKRFLPLSALCLFAFSVSFAEPDPCGSSRGRLSTREELQSLNLMDTRQPAADIEIDLTGDGLSEYLTGHQCGNAACNYVIFFQEEPRKYRCVGTVFLHRKAFIPLFEKHNDFYDLLTYQHLSAELGTLARLQFDGREYQSVHKIEGKASELAPFVGRFERR